MTNDQKRRYSEPELLKDILERVLKGKKFRLECGTMFHLAITWATTLQFTMAGNSKLFVASAAIEYNLTKEGH